MIDKNFTVDVDQDGVALMTWNVPGRTMNVITLEGIAELAAIVETLVGDTQVKGAVIASGKDSFCAGVDLTLLESLSRTYAELARAAGEAAATARLFEESRKLSLLYRRIETCGKPFVAAINGTAVGGGFELALACHHRVAATNPKARLGLPEVKVGLFPGAGGTTRISRMLAPADALQFLLKGEQVSVARAKAMKLLDAVVPPGRTRQRRKGLDQGRRQGEEPVGCGWLPAARWNGLFQIRDDDVFGGQRTLSARDLRQLSGRPRDPAGRL